MHRFLFTFDIEDSINPNAICALHIVLEMLDKYRLRALFFITGHMAEKLSNFPEIVTRLNKHEIGFHSSGHSVRPIIQEYTDVKSYRQAYSISLKRETAHINPLTGKVDGEGGIYVLQDLFSPKKIEAFRAPGMSWSPPHLEALVELGIEFDFSSNITASESVYYRGVTFYPYTFTQQWEGNRSDYQCLLSAILRQKITVLGLHPTWYANQDMWDSIYYKGNPPCLLKALERPIQETASLFLRLELLLKQINHLRKAKLIDVTPNLNKPSTDFSITKNDVQKCYETSAGWPKRYFNYSPRFIWNHFQRFFNQAYCIR